MNKGFLTILLCSFSFILCFSQDVTFNSQADVDAVNSSITTIDGNLTIETDTGSSDPISDLFNLSNLTSITGGLRITYNPALTNLDGLANISSIGGYISIEENDVLTNLNGLTNLSSIEGNLVIDYNAALTNVNGLANISAIGGYLDIYDNDALTNIDGLANLSSIEESLSIADNADLINVDGLANLSSVGGYLDIYDNDALTNMDSLTNLSSIGGNLDISGNPALANVDGLTNLSFMGGDLYINYNSSLTNLDGLANLSSVGGYLGIYENFALTNLDGLTNISAIGGYLEINDNSSLTNLDGLANTSAIGGYLNINDNSSLTNVDGLANISAIERYLNIKNNAALTNLDGLTNISVIGEYLDIENNTALTNLNGLTNLSAVGGYLNINNNAALTNLNGLTNLSSIGGYLDINDNISLTNLDGLANLSSIGENLNINNNTALTNLDELANLSTIGGYLNIYNNDALTNLDGLANLSSIGGNLSIYNNDALFNCCAIQVLLSTPNAIGGNSNIYNNPSECSSVEEIDGICLGLDYSGNTYYDLNQNQEWDDFEVVIPTQQIQVDPQNNILFTNQNGLYFTFCEEGQAYTFSWIEDSDWILTTDSTSYSTVFEPYNLDNQNNNFGLYPTFTNHDYSINTTSGQTRCNTDVNFHVDVCNQGTFLETDGTVTINYDELIGYVNAVPEPLEVDTMAHTITWVYDTLYPWQCLNYLITFEMPDVESIGGFIEVNTEVSRDSIGMSVLAQQDIFEAEIVCSYDPNDKLVDPRGEQDENYTLKEETFDYTVRFQNTGNIAAIDVTIRDTLDADLDWSTFRVEQASHAVQTTLSQDGAVTFYFKDIYLPDSLSNPLGSQGFVRYTIDPIGGLPDYTVIDNTAYIYFDQNPPIITNTTTNTLVDEIPVGVEDLTKTNAFQLYPNPTTGQVYIVMDESLQNKNHQWQLRDVTGNVLRQYDALPNAELDLSGYPSGLYMIFLLERGTGQMLGAKRVLVTK